MTFMNHESIHSSLEEEMEFEKEEKEMKLRGMGKRQYCFNKLTSISGIQQ